MHDAEPPARGRPLDPAVTEAILRATGELLSQGYSVMSVEDVAKRAGVGKTAIYRRYSNKAELAAAALATLRAVDEELDLGSARAEIREHLRRSHAAIVEGPGLSMAGTLLVERHRNPELLEGFRARVIHPVMRVSRASLERGQARGEIREDVDLDAALEALVGQLYARALTGNAFDDTWLDRALETVFGGIEPR